MLTTRSKGLAPGRNAAVLNTVILACAATFFAIFGSKLHADWLNLSGAEVAENIVEFHVEDDGVRVLLEAYVGDLSHYRDLIPREWMPDREQDLASDAERVANFAKNGLAIRTETGAVLPAELVLIDRRVRVDRSSPLAGTIDPYSGRKRPEPPEDPRVLYVELFYPFGDTRPESLEFIPMMTDEDRPVVVTGFVVFHREVPVIDFRYLSAPTRLSLNWEDPWYSRFDNPNLTRHHKYPRMVFLYAEPYEIRHEALIRVRDAAQLVGLTPNSPTLTQQEATELKERAAQVLGERSPLSIEGKAVTADFDRGSYMRIGQRGLEILPPGTPVNVDAGILGLIWSAPTDGLPKDAEVEWTWYDETAPEVAGYAIDAAGPFLSPLSAEDPILKWTNHFKKSPYPEITSITAETPDYLPFSVYILGGIVVLGLGQALLFGLRPKENRWKGVLIGVGVAGLAAVAIPFALSRQAAQIPDMDQEQLTALAESLLNNVYRAFDFRLEDQVYDRLALTLEGDILEDVYLAQREALRIERAGGADARVEELIVTNVEALPPLEPGTMRLRADWAVRGSVGHWGHLHSRANTYQADLTIAPVDGAWEIQDFEVMSQERVL